MANIFTKIFGSRNDRILKEYKKTVSKINQLEAAISQLTDSDLQSKTTEFKQRLANGESLNKLLPEAFAVVRETAQRTLGMRHFDVQLIGGIALHQGKIAEMRTGEGKTLTATLAIYLNALSEKGVHVVTVNDYLARRDAEEMRPLFNFLGMTVGVNQANTSSVEKQLAYRADITYGTNNEYGFDYLRDNMVYSKGERVQRKLHYAIVDEVDSILIDEARTPLIISGQADSQAETFSKINTIVPKLKKQIGEEHVITGEGVIEPGDFTVDEKSQQIYITEEGHEKIEQIMAQMGLIPQGTNLYDPANIILLHNLNSSLRAHHLFHRDQQYVVVEGDNGKEIIIVDEFTGRLMPGRRWSDGLHQAIEAKENVAINAENQTLASITFQNYFRLYEKLSGMTGTADTEAYEFQTIYGLETVAIPPNLPSKRQDQQDRIYKTEQEKYQAAIKDIKECYEKGQPVLVGTSSIENSEIISALLKKEKLPHEVLNAKQHEREADIITQAGRKKTITIATNMAGRGTDIVLGGNIKKEINEIKSNPNLSAEQKQQQLTQLEQQWQQEHEEVKQLGGLRIVATERHESRRIDNQLRGRSGRQGDPGSSRFYLSLDDPLMRIFAGERVKAVMTRLKMPEGEAIEAKMVSRSIETAQRKVEGRNFDIRKQLLEYDDVANEQRKSLYQQRNSLLDDEDIQPMIDNLRDNLFIELVNKYVPADTMEELWDTAELQKVLKDEWQVNTNLVDLVSKAQSISAEEISLHVRNAAKDAMQTKIDLAGKAQFMDFAKAVLLQNIDLMWREHLNSLDYLRRGIHLRGYAQKDPKREYKREAFELFANMLDSIREQSIKIFMNVRIESAENVQQATEKTQNRQLNTENLNYQGGSEVKNANEANAQKFAHVGRNEPCPCNSGKKFKFCHGKLS